MDRALQLRDAIVFRAVNFRSDLRLAHHLKPRWGTSIAALQFRAHELKVGSDAQYRRNMMEMGKRGYKKGSQPLYPWKFPGI